MTGHNCIAPRIAVNPLYDVRIQHTLTGVFRLVAPEIPYGNAAAVDHHAGNRHEVNIEAELWLILSPGRCRMQKNRDRKIPFH